MSIFITLIYRHAKNGNTHIEMLEPIRIKAEYLFLLLLVVAWDFFLPKTADFLHKIIYILLKF